MNPGKVMTVPDAVNSTCRPSVLSAERRTVVVAVCALTICDATVRFQIKSYSANSSPTSSPAISAGERNESPEGRIASCASCAFFTLRSYSRGLSGTYSLPYNSLAWLRAAFSACSDSVVESVRM